MSRFDLHIKVSEDGKVMIGGVKKKGGERAGILICRIRNCSDPVISKINHLNPNKIK
jgi:hypothetical protein